MAKESVITFFNCIYCYLINNGTNWITISWIFTQEKCTGFLMALYWYEKPMKDQWKNMKFWLMSRMGWIWPPSSTKTKLNQNWSTTTTYISWRRVRIGMIKSRLYCKFDVICINLFLSCVVAINPSIIQHSCYIP